MRISSFPTTARPVVVSETGSIEFLRPGTTERHVDADADVTKRKLAEVLNGLIANRRLTQGAAAEILGVTQPKVSALANYKLGGFSVERLMTFLTALGQDVEITIRGQQRSPGAGPGAGRVRIVADE